MYKNKKKINIFFTIIILFVLQCQISLGSYDISAKEMLQINTQNTTMKLVKNVIIKKDKKIFFADEVTIDYINTTNIEKNLKNQSFINFNIINATGNVKMMQEKSILSGDELIYNIPKKIIVLRSKTNPVIYDNENTKLIAKKQIEYQEEDNMLVARGKPKIITTNTNGKNIQYTIHANLISAKVSNQKDDIEYMEAFDNIKIINQESTITGNYALFDNQNNTLYISDNVKLIQGGANLSLCKIILDITTGKTDLIPCGKNSKINAQFNNTQTGKIKKI